MYIFLLSGIVHWVETNDNTVSNNNIIGHESESIRLLWEP